MNKCPSTVKRQVLACTLLVCAALQAHAAPLDPNAYASLGSLTLASGNYVLDTSGPAPRLLDAVSSALLFTGVFQTQADTFNPRVAVFDFDNVTIASGTTISAVGANPLALLSRAAFSFYGTLDAAGKQGGPQGNGFGGAAGPGGGAGGPGGSGGGNPGEGPGGGAGGYPGLGNGSWGEGGAYGGAGSNWNPARSPALAYGDPALVLQGGSGGGAGGANLFGSGPGGGGGGGGVEFGALGGITLGGGSLLSVAGGAFNDGLAVNAGGGAGGGVLMHASAIDFLSSALGNAKVDASGFSGGRITFLTPGAQVGGNTSGVTVAGDFYGHPGVITYGTLSPVPEPSAAALLLLGLALLLRLGSVRRPMPATLTAA